MKRILLSLTLLGALFCATALPAAPAAKTNESALIKVLESKASNREKSDACSKLKLIATGKSVSALAGLLTNQELSHSARYVLESLPDTKADKALRKALGKTSGDLQVGVINSIGMRRDADAVSDLGKLLRSTNQAAAIASAEALGRIGNASALKKLQGALPTSVGAPHLAQVDAILMCGNRLLAAGKRPEALKVFQALYISEPSGTVRQAVYSGMIAASSDGGLELTLAGIGRGDATSRAASLHAAAGLKGAEATKALADLAIATKASIQLALIECLVQRNDPVAAPAIVRLADNSEMSVRIAAIAALGSLGDESVIDLLVSRAASASGEERKAAQQALLQLNRGPITTRMLAMLHTDSPKIKSELLLALGGRGDSTATPTLLEIARHGKEDERAAALQAVGELADARQIPDLVQLVATADTDDIRSQAADALAGIYLRVPAAKDQDVEPLVKAVTTGSADTRVALLPVCSELAQKTVREALRAAIKDSDARVRDAGIHAMVDTHDPDLLPDLLDLADGKSGDTIRPLAIRGCVHLTSQEDEVKIPKDTKLAAFKQLLQGKLTADDKRLVLSGISTVNDPQALDMALGLVNDPEVQVEAEQAVIEVCKLIRPAHTPRVRTTLNKLVAETKNADNRKAAQNLIDLLK